MCCLFGLMDFNRVLSTHQKNKILSVLSQKCEARGTDATGIAYNFGGQMRKTPCAGTPAAYSRPKWRGYHHGTHPYDYTGQCYV